MVTPVRIGMDTSKSVFQLHGVDDKEAVVLHRQFRRNEMIRYFEKPPPTLVAIEFLREFPPLGPAIAVVRTRGEADPSAVCEALREAWEERHRRRGGAVRGGHSAHHAVRAGEVARTSSRMRDFVVGRFCGIFCFFLWGCCNKAYAAFMYSTIIPHRFFAIAQTEMLPKRLHTAFESDAFQRYQQPRPA